MTINLGLWESNMTEFGGYVKTYAANNASTDFGQLNAYYDGIHVFDLIRAYTGDSATWDPAIAQALINLRDYYFIFNKGAILAYWNFTRGVADHFIRTGDATSGTALDYLSTSANTPNLGAPFLVKSPFNVSNLPGTDYSREAAYALQAIINRSRAGLSVHSGNDSNGYGYYSASEMADLVRGHFTSWFTREDSDYVRCFMVGISMRSLIHYNDFLGSPLYSDIQIIARACDYLWRNCWLGTAFAYTDRITPNPQVVGDPPSDIAASPDLNMLIGPAYEWLYQKTSEPWYRDAADQIFNGGLAVYSGAVWVSGAYFGGRNATSVLGKQFNQSYLWSFDHVSYRSGTPSRLPTGLTLGI